MSSTSWFKRMFRPSEVEQALEKKLTRLENEMAEMFADYEVKYLDSDTPSAGGPGQFEMAGMEMTITPAMLQRLYTSETWVYAAVNAVAETLSGTPWKLEQRHLVTKVLKDEHTGKDVEVKQEIWTDASGTKLFERFQYPNPDLSREEFIAFLAIDLLTTGSCYIYLHSDDDLSLIEGDAVDNDPDKPFGRLRTQLAATTKVKAMYRLPPSMMIPVPKENGVGLEGYAIETEEGMFAFDTAEIIHTKLPNPLDQYSGLAPLLPAFRPMLLERYSSEHMVRFYKTGARLGGVIETDKDLNKEQLSRFQRSFENNFTGRQNFHRTMILPKGMHYNTVEQNPVQDALVTFSKYNREAVLAAYRVPPIKVGIVENANRANSDTQDRIFYENSIIPRARLIESGFNRKASLMPDNRSFRIRFDFSGVEVLQENFKDKAESGEKMLRSGLTVNEVRKIVWNVEPLKDGDKSPAVETMKNDVPLIPEIPTVPAPTAAPAAAAPTQEQDKPTDQAQDAIAQNQVTDPALSLSGAQVTAMMNIVSQVAQGFLPRSTGVEMIIVSFSVPREAAERVMGAVGGSFVPKPDASVAPAEEAKPADTQIGIESGKAAEEDNDDDDDPSDPDGSGPGSSSSSESDPGSQPPPASSDSSKEVTPNIASVAQAPTLYGFGMSKDQVVESWKGFLSTTEPMIVNRMTEVQKFFKSFQSVIMNRVGVNIKAYGIFKSRDSEDIDEILDPSAFDHLVAEYVASVDTALLAAYKYGYADTLVKYKFDPRNEQALEALKKFAANKVKGITDTTRAQIREVLTEAFDEGVAMTEVSSRLQEKFAQMETGRAETIARTETLTAVSIGREEKRQDFKQQFPEMKLMKMWVSAQDDKVRDSHQEYDGKSVEDGAEFAPGLKFPRDPDCAEPSEVINCRCTDMTFPAEDQKLIEDTMDDEKGFVPDVMKYSPDQERDDLGRFGAGGGGSSGGGGSDDKPPRGPVVSLADHNAAGESTITDAPIPGTRPWLSGSENDGEGIDRPKSTVAPKEIEAANTTNKFSDGPYSDYTNGERFTKTRGSSLNLNDTAAFQKYAGTELRKNVLPALEHARAAFAADGINVLEVKARDKAGDSLLKKMNGKWSDKTLDQVTDGIGARFVVQNQKDADKIVAKFASTTGMSALEHKDYMADPKAGGYRAQHLLVRTPGGFMAEVQVKTQNQDTFSRWAHDDIYKNEKLNKDKEVAAYGEKVSKILADIDMGRTPTDPVPEPPKVLQKAKLEFPWSKVNKKPY